MSGDNIEMDPRDKIKEGCYAFTPLTVEAIGLKHYINILSGLSHIGVFNQELMEKPTPNDDAQFDGELGIFLFNSYGKWGVFLVREDPDPESQLASLPPDGSCCNNADTIYAGVYSDSGKIMVGVANGMFRSKPCNIEELSDDGMSFVNALLDFVRNGEYELERLDGEDVDEDTEEQG